MTTSRIFQKRGGQLGCSVTGKTAFETQELAQKRLIEIQSKVKTTLSRVYRCPKCKLWHLTSSQNRPKRIRQRERFGNTSSKRVPVVEDTPKIMKRVEDLWANYLGLKEQEK